MQPVVLRVCSRVGLQHGQFGGHEGRALLDGDNNFKTAEVSTWKWESQRREEGRRAEERPSPSHQTKDKMEEGIGPSAREAPRESRHVQGRSHGPHFMPRSLSSPWAADPVGWGSNVHLKAEAGPTRR